MATPQKTQLTISILTISKIILVLAGFYFLFLVSDIIAKLFIAFVIFSAINPIVDKLHNRRIPRMLGVIIIYFGLFAVIASVILLLAPYIAEQGIEIAKSLPQYLEKTFNNFSQIKEYSQEYGLLEEVKNNLTMLQDSAKLGAQGIFSFVVGIFGGISSFFIILVITFYMIAERDSIKTFLSNTISVSYRKQALAMIEAVQDKLGLWARAQAILSVAIFILTFFFLSIFGIKYALVLALIAGLTEFIPYLGPILGAIPAVIIAFFQSPFDALIVIIIYLVIQQIENIILVPQVMKRAVGINPVVSIIALMAAFRLGGILGAIMAIPIVVVISVILDSFVTSHNVHAKVKL